MAYEPHAVAYGMAYGMSYGMAYEPHETVLKAYFFWPMGRPMNFMRWPMGWPMGCPMGWPMNLMKWFLKPISSSTNSNGSSDWHKLGNTQPNQSASEEQLW